MEGFWYINIKDLIYITVTVTTVIIAIVGYGKWKRELLWKTYFDFAHRFLIAAYSLRDILHTERAKLFTLPIHMQNTTDISEERQWDIVEYHKEYYKCSLSQVQDSAIAYESLLTEGEVLFGKVFRNTAQKMISQTQLYKRAVAEHLEYEYSKVGMSDYHLSTDEYNNDILVLIRIGQATKTDEFGQSNEKIIKELDGILIKHIRPKK